MSFLSLTDADREAMLATVGVATVEELFRDIPEAFRLRRPLDLEPALSELELARHLEELAGRNVHVGQELSFLGYGVYDHYTPAVVDVLMSRGEFLTAYTPYQPEMSQGVLQAIFEYQTAICELTGMEVSNASGYDGCTVAADACFLAKAHTGRTKVVLAESLHPMVRQIVATFAPGFGMEVVTVPHDGGTTDAAAWARACEGAACAIFQTPNVFGCLEDGPALAAATNEAGRCRWRMSTCCRWASSRRLAPTAARSRLARGRAPATRCRSAARTSASWPRRSNWCARCPAASSARRSIARASAPTC